jgi:translation initiation factor IF-3
MTRRTKIKRFYNLNQYIRAAQVRVIDEQGQQIGVMTKDEALFRARQKGLDLVEVAGNVTPPVCKIIDFKKFKYQEDKKQKAGKKRKVGQETKEIRFTPFIAQNDFNIRIERSKEFLNEGHRVKLTVRFVGRQLSHKEFGYELIKKATAQLQEVGKIDGEPKWLGKMLIINLVPLKKK